MGNVRGDPYFMKNDYVSEENARGLRLYLAQVFAEDLAQLR